MENLEDTISAASQTEEGRDTHACKEERKRQKHIPEFAEFVGRAEEEFACALFHVCSGVFVTFAVGRVSYLDSGSVLLERESESGSGCI